MVDNLEALTAHARWALECWRPVAGQVHMLSDQVAKKEHVRLILDAGAVRAQMAWRDVPVDARARVWDLVMLLHDLDAHDGRGYSRICYQHSLDRALVDFGCPTCRLWLRREGLLDGPS